MSFARRHRTKLGFFFGMFVGALLVASTFRAAPLPAPAPYDGELPTASPPAEMSLTVLPTGVTHRSAAFAYRGGSFRDARDFSMTAVLVRHPRGDVLIDTGLGRKIVEQMPLMPWWFRLTTSYTAAKPAADQLDAMGYDRTKLRAILLTHAHWDHVSGLPDFPGTPIWVTAVEHAFVDDGGWITAFARSATAAKWEEYALDGGPYLGFPHSHDVYGDGAIVIVSAPGHTPGSVIVFVTLPTMKRFAFLGDLVWQREGITEREERPFIQRALADVDADVLRESLLRVSALHAKYPEIVLVPAHDQRGFAEMP